MTSGSVQGFNKIDSSDEDGAGFWSDISVPDSL